MVYGCRQLYGSRNTFVKSKVHDILIGGIEYKQLSYTGVSYAELSRYPLVMLERKSISRLCIDDFFEKAGISLSPVLKLGSLDLIISFVRNNMGLAFIPMELCGQFIDNNEIFQSGWKVRFLSEG
jgi:DNA-binding transcriptional LysR family regulator